MSKFNDFLYYINDKGIDLDNTKSIEMEFFRFYINNKIENAPEPDNDSLLHKFFKEIIYEPKETHYYKVLVLGQNDTEHCQLIFNNFKDFYKSVSTLIKETDLNIYYLPICLKKKRVKNIGKTENTMQSNSFFIDIDDIDFKFSTNTYEGHKQEILDFLATNYNVPENSLPRYVVKSGHGLHLYYLMPLIDGPSPQRKDLISSVCTYFSGDFTCASVAHIIRCPNSYNAKQTKSIPTELFLINEDATYDLDYLKPIMASEEEVKKAKELFNSRRAEKCRATREKNGTSNSAKKEIKSKKSKPTHMPTNAKKPPSEKKEAIKSDFSNVSCEHTKTDIVINPNYKNLKPCSDFWLELRRTDLLNYYYRRGGNIKGYRNTFFHIYISTLLNLCIDFEDILDVCTKLADDDFKDQVIDIANYMKSHKRYTYSNIRIGQLLNFTKADFNCSYLCYSKTEKEQKYKDKYKRYYNKTKKNRFPVYNKEARLSFIKDNPTLTNKQISTILNVSTKTIQRDKKEIKEKNYKYIY